MGNGLFAKLRQAVGLKTLDERIGDVHDQMSAEREGELQVFHAERDVFAQELETLQDRDDASLIGRYETVFGESLDVKVLPEDFQIHKYAIGGSGCGKSCFLEHLIGQHILREEGAGLIDCHGDVYANLCRWIAYKTYDMAAEEREQYLREKVVLVDLTDDERVIGLNPLAPQPGMDSDRQANQLLLIFRRFYQDRWGVKIEELARFAFMALIEAGGTLLELEELLINEAFRAQLLAQVRTPEVARYFSTQLHRDTAFIPSLLNKLRPLLLDGQVQAALGQSRSTLRFRDILDHNKILLVNLNKSYLSANADIMGAFFVGLLQAAILSRRDTPPSHRRPFFLYVDEFQNYANEQLEEVLTESRKYGLFLTMAHQSLSQLPRSLQEIIRGNTDMQLFFRMSYPDARTLAPGNFAATGRMERPQLSPYTSPEHPADRFYTESEELARSVERLSSQPKRHLFYRHKDKPYKAQPIVTADLPALPDELGISPAELDAWTKECVACSTAAYTRKKKDVQAEIIARQHEWQSANGGAAPPQHPAGREAGLADLIPDVGDFKEREDRGER